MHRGSSKASSYRAEAHYFDLHRKRRAFQKQQASKRKWLAVACIASCLLLLGIVNIQSISLNAKGLSPTESPAGNVLDPLWQIFQPRRARAPKIGIQIGHLQASKHPKELQDFRQNTGGYANGVSEVDINQKVAYELYTLLQAEGLEVDILPATIPINYKADIFLSLHADSVGDSKRRGYKSSTPLWHEDDKDIALKKAIDSHYLEQSGLPDDHINVSSNMSEFYGFNRDRYLHSVAKDTPSLLVEMGYISNASDLAFLQDPSKPAQAISAGILAFLAENR